MATIKDSGGGFVHECFYRCESKRHASNLTTAVTKASLSDEKVAAYLKWCCVKYAQAVDSYGRSLIHVAASMGRLKLLMFLLSHREVNVNCKDQESLFSALHRSLYYGQIHCAVRLIQAGANLLQTDLDDLTPLDHVKKDQECYITFSRTQPCEVYIWGTNTNYTLGIGHNHSRSNPEPLDLFRKENISIKQAYMSKFHSLFLGHNGKVWTCGLGSGGRLGLGDEATTLVPKVLKIGNSSSESCKAASLGIDHSLLLLENGSVWSFGLNNYHQLGHSPVPEKVLFPKAIKALKGLEIIGISASKFHSVFWTDSQLFSCGLHGGQLGHLKTKENTISVPKLVTIHGLKFSKISHVATSDGATVLVSDKGDVFLFHEYQCKKLTSKTRLQAKKICVIGGNLDHKVSSSCLREKGGDELKILVLTSGHRIYLWEETLPQMTRCLLSLRRCVVITDIVLNRASLILTVENGEAYHGEIKLRKKKLLLKDEKPPSPKSNCTKFLNKDECYSIKVNRIPHVHRAVNAASDMKGRNFAIVQAHPKNCLTDIPVVESTEMKQNFKMLLTTASEFDTLHDVVFEVNGIRFPAHRYIVSHSSKVIEEMINKSEDIESVHTVKIDTVQPQIFERILCYLYTGECDLLQIGPCPISFEHSVPDAKPVIRPDPEVLNREDISAFEYHKQRTGKRKNENKTESKGKDPVKALLEAAKMFELTDLAKFLETLRYDNGHIRRTNEKNAYLPPVKFNRKNLQNLWDIHLRSENGEIIKAHKCILIARLEYFNCMINMGWLESTLKTPLNLPIPGNVLEILIRFLYTDEAPELVDSNDPDLASHVLVIADQYFCAKLKEIAESTLACLVNLKNAAEVLQLSVTYNANQLKQSAMEFICINLTALLESQSLEILDDEVLTDLKDYYRSWLPCMSGRSMATNSGEPDDEFVETIYNSEPVSLEKVEEEATLKPSSKAHKKKPREKKNSESERVRNTSVGSTTSDEELFSSLDYCESGAKEETWIMVGKQQKVGQGKSKAPPAEVSSPKTPVLVKSPAIPIQKSSPISVVPLPPRVKKDSIGDLDREFVLLSTSSEKEFPALSASAPERITTIVSPKSPSESNKKFVKLSQKQRKRLAIQSISEDEESSKKPQEVFKSVWGVPKIESQSLADIMRQESRTGSQHGSVASSPPWQGPSSPSCSLSAIMAAERQQRDLLTKMKSKPLEYTQMEDKAIDDLTLLYDISNVTDERITVRRADSVLFSPPVWVSGHR